jgi:energy-coupling factor transporter transmembrane protein EcfT
MQSSLIFLFIFSLVMAGISFFIGFMRPYRPGTYLSKAGFIIWLFLLAPFLTWVLYQQSGSVDRLEHTGFTAHPATVEAVGLANGAGENPTWLFKVDATPDEVLDFYNAPESHPGWALVAKTPKLLMFRKGEKKMDIFASDDWRNTSVMYKLSSREKAGGMRE